MYTSQILSFAVREIKMDICRSSRTHRPIYLQCTSRGIKLGCSIECPVVAEQTFSYQQTRCFVREH